MRQTLSSKMSTTLIIIRIRATYERLNVKIKVANVLTRR